MAYNMADCLPPVGLRVLVWDKAKGLWAIDTLQHMSAEEENVALGTILAFELYNFDEITHWLKLPRNPDLDTRGRMPGEDFSL